MPRFWFAIEGGCLCSMDEEAREFLSSLTTREVEVDIIALDDESTRERNLLFACVDLLFKNWPHDHWFRPYSSRMLRSWLMQQAGFAEAVEFDVPGWVSAKDMAEFLNNYVARAVQRVADKGKFPLVSYELQEDGSMRSVVYEPMTLKRGKLGRAQLHDLMEAMDVVLSRENLPSIANLKLALRRKCV